MSKPSARSGAAPSGPARGDSSATPRKTYVPPKLVEYGSASKLTTSKPGTTSDGGNTILKAATCL